MYELSIDFQICNVVSSFKLDRRMDLSKIFQAYKSISIWNDQVFRKFVLIMRIPRPKMSLLIYETGKVICSGAKSREHALRSSDILIEMLQKKGIEVKILCPPEIHNMVAVASYGRDLNLDILALSFEEVEYEPEQFPGPRQTSRPSLKAKNRISISPSRSTSQTVIPPLSPSWRSDRISSASIIHLGFNSTTPRQQDIINNEVNIPTRNAL